MLIEPKQRPNFFLVLTPKNVSFFHSEHSFLNSKMAAANFEVMSSTSSGSSSSDEHDEAANFGGKTRLDFSHRELDSDMLEIHLAGLAEVPGRYYF